MPYVIALIAGLSGLLFGYDEGIIAGALTSLRAHFGISPLAEGAVTAAVPLGALIGSIGGARLADTWGRRMSLIGAGVLFAVGALLAGFAQGPGLLAGARLILGLAIGVAAVAAPLYIAENAAAKKRGMLVSFYQLAITIGIVLAYVAGFALGESWRIMFLLGMIPGVALTVAMLFMRDTPRWLMSRGREDEARTALADALGNDATPQEQSAAIHDMQDAISNSATHAGWGALLAPCVRPALVVAVGLFVLQQLSGINAVIYYAPMVFREAGFDTHSTQLLATIGIGVVNVVMTLVSMALIDRLGRRRMLFIGFAGTALSMGVIATGALLQASWLNMAATICMPLYIASFALSVGPLPWLMMSEIFPLAVRPLGMAAASAANWTFNALVVFLFPVGLAAFGLGHVFAGFSIICLFGLAFTWRYVPETAGVSLETIERNLREEAGFGALVPGGRAAKPA